LIQNILKQDQLVSNKATAEQPYNYALCLVFSLRALNSKKVFNET